MDRRALLLALAAAAGTPALAGDKAKKSDCTFKGFKLYGKVQIVEHFPDFKVQVVEHFPDLKVQKVTSFPDSCGKWQIVEHFPDFKIQLVEHFPDLKIQWVEHFPGIP
jgi:hypothetical protein